MLLTASDICWNQRFQKPQAAVAFLQAGRGRFSHSTAALQPHHEAGRCQRVPGTPEKLLRSPLLVLGMGEIVFICCKKLGLCLGLIEVGNNPFFTSAQTVQVSVPMATVVLPHSNGFRQPKATVTFLVGQELRGLGGRMEEWACRSPSLLLPTCEPLPSPLSHWLFILGVCTPGLQQQEPSLVI